MKKICIITAVPSTVNAFLCDHIHLLSTCYDITVVTNLEVGELSALPENVHIHSMPIERNINLFSDTVALFKLWLFFKKEQFDITLSVTPKAGLLTSIASCLSFIPIRIHWFTGQVWATRKGLKRSFLKVIDKIQAFCITDALVDSESQYKFLLDENVLKAQKGQVLGFGSISGVDTEKFKFNRSVRNEFRSLLNIKENDKVIIFLGRLNRDKGVYDLIEAFEKMQYLSNVQLVLVGPDEESVQSKVAQTTNLSLKNIHFTGHTNSPECWLSIADVFCLPSYREGFGTSVIEAASVGIPAVASRIYGLTDAVEENLTGLMHEPGNIEDLKLKLEAMIEDDILRKQLAENAQTRVSKYFRQEAVSQLLMEYLDGKSDKERV